MRQALRAIATFVSCLPLLALASTEGLAQPGPKGSVYKTWTLKNTSPDQTANDLHTIVTNKTGTIVEAISVARSAAFTDPPTGEGTSTLDWPNAGNPGGSVPPGLSDKIGICNEDTDFRLKLSDTFFTKDGAMLPTQYITHSQTWDIDMDAATVSLEIGNPPSLAQGPIRILNLQIHVDNDVANFELGDSVFPYETPTGSLVVDTSDIDLAEGQTMSFDLGAVGHGYELAIATVAPLGDLSNTFVVATGFRPPAVVPSLSGWALPVFGLVLAISGALMVRAARLLRP